MSAQPDDDGWFVSWQMRASCRDYHYKEAERLWFPEPKPGLTKASNTAIRVCFSCPVQAECLAFAVTRREEYGIWGGALPTLRAERNRALGDVTDAERVRDIAEAAESYARGKGIIP